MTEYNKVFMENSKNIIKDQGFTNRVMIYCKKIRFYGEEYGWQHNRIGKFSAMCVSGCGNWSVGS